MYQGFKKVLSFAPPYPFRTTAHCLQYTAGTVQAPQYVMNNDPAALFETFQIMT